MSRKVQGPTVKHLQELELPHDAAALDFSNDGAHLAIAIDGTNGPSVKVISTKDGSTVAEANNGERAQSVAFTSGGKTVHFLTWNADNRPRLSKLDLNSQKVDVVEDFSPNEHTRFLVRDESGQYLAALGYQVHGYDLNQGAKARKVFKFTGIAKVMKRGCFAAEAPKMYVSDYEEDHIVLLEPVEEEVLGKWESLGGRTPEQILVSLDHRFLAIVGKGFTGLALYDLTTKKRILHDEFKNDTKTRAIAFSSDSKFLTILNYSLFVYELPAVTELENPKRLHEATGYALRSASARDRNLIAYAIDREQRVLWFELS